MSRKTSAPREAEAPPPVIRCPDALAPLLEPIGGLREHPRNVRFGHSLKMIVRSLEEHGWHAPIVANRDGLVLAGNGRLAAATKLGATVVPVLRVDDDEAQGFRRMVADNRAGEFSLWDLEELRQLGGALDSMRDAFRLEELLGQIALPTAPEAEAGLDDAASGIGERPEDDSHESVDRPLEPCIWEVSFAPTHGEAAALMTELDRLAGVVVRRL